MDATSRERDLLERAGLVVTAHRADVRFTCTVDRWPGVELTAAVDPRHVDAFVAGAATDVADLWPSRDTGDGAISLLATHLEAELAKADVPPGHVALSSRGTWLLGPRDADGGGPPGR
ncbi:hypothetical protein SAMN05216184_1013 [Georgenia satyanarayanai]|uniref:Uncharacterized protein n=1 Tax=Georgenia satyanarayanai TaxID=860221 RepID=A0A2Y8ZWL5_9MICO|nr:hypothetical protein [Georgenia satyanarayanai]PYG01545.1 hypothetical protein A8987_1013 [Georgenia satyanarayanai]SSA36345.1 hypothetical protein SAMN05216184_1013 [Georgenia satyanarayanai]